MKTCTTCRTSKSTESFSNYKASRDGLHNQCKSCVQNYNVRTRHLRKEWRKANKERIDAQNRLYRENNKPSRNYLEATRRCNKMNRTPKWLTEAQINEMKDMYTTARKLGMHVDHIVPLQGKLVSGLHVPWNLQHLTPFDNCSKNNKFTTHFAFSFD